MHVRHVRFAFSPVLVLVALLVGFAPAAAQPPTAGVAAIETTAPLDDESEASVKEAIASAVKSAFRGALAMGLPWVQVAGAYVRPGYVGVKVLAMAQRPAESESDEEPGDTAPDTHEPAPGPPVQRGPRVEL